MSVQVSVPLSALSDARVAHALNNLLAALGGVSLAAPSERRAATPAPAAPRGDTDARYAAFIEALPERSRAFLELVEARNVLTIDDAMSALDVKVGKAMGGITGSIARWAPEHDVLVPFEAIKSPDGKRAWRWIGFDQRPAPPVPVRGRRRRRSASPAASGSRALASDPEVASAPPEPGPPPTVAERVLTLKASLPETTAQFIGLLEERGALSQAEVLEHFGLARAQGLSRILTPLATAAARLDLAELIETEVSPTGERGWRWGLRAREANSARPTAPTGGPIRPGVRVRKPH